MPGVLEALERNLIVIAILTNKHYQQYEDPSAQQSLNES